MCIGRRRDRTDAAVADAARRSRAVLPRKLWADSIPDPPYAGPIWRVPHAAFGRGPRRHRTHAGRASNPTGDIREPDQSHQQDCRYRRNHASGARTPCHDPARQHVRRCASAWTVRDRHLSAQSDEIRLRTRRCHGRCGDRQGGRDRHTAAGFHGAWGCARSARGLSAAAWTEDLLRALWGAVRQCAADCRVPVRLTRRSSARITPVCRVIPGTRWHGSK